MFTVMARNKKTDAEKLIEIPCKVAPRAVQALEQIAEQTDRPKGAVARKLLMHGLAAVLSGTPLEQLDQPYREGVGQTLTIDDLRQEPADGEVVGRKAVPPCETIKKGACSAV